MALRRDWRDAVAHHDGKPCRVCLRWPRELAHVIPRTNDAVGEDGRRRSGVVRVHPLAVIPLCPDHHRLYDARRLNVRPYLKPAELKHASSQLGETAALQYILGPAARL